MYQSTTMYAMLSPSASTAARSSLGTWQTCSGLESEMSKRRKRLTEEDANRSTRNITSMKVEGEEVPPSTSSVVFKYYDIVPMFSSAGLEAFVKSGVHRDEFFKFLRRSGYANECALLGRAPEVGHQQGITAFLCLCAETALNSLAYYPFLEEDAYWWLEAKFREQGVDDSFALKWQGYRAWVSMGRHIYFRWPTGVITTYWIGEYPKKPLSRLWLIDSSLSPEQLDRSHCMITSMLSSRF